MKVTLKNGRVIGNVVAIMDGMNRGTVDLWFGPSVEERTTAEVVSTSDIASIDVAVGWLEGDIYSSGSIEL